MHLRTKKSYARLGIASSLIVLVGTFENKPILIINLTSKAKGFYKKLGFYYFVKKVKF